MRWLFIGGPQDGQGLTSDKFESKDYDAFLFIGHRQQTVHVYLKTGEGVFTFERTQRVPIHMSAQQYIRHLDECSRYRDKPWKVYGVAQLANHKDDA